MKSKINLVAKTSFARNEQGNGLRLEQGGYRRRNQWDYIRQISAKKRFHAKLAGQYVYIHMDGTVGWRHMVIFRPAILIKEINRIKRVKIKI